MKEKIVIAIVALTAACTPGWMGSSDPGPTPQLLVRAPSNAASFRVVESATGNTVSFTSLVDRASFADVVCFGEQHDDPETHFLEFALLEGIGQRRNDVVLSLEMFERDVQATLNQYLSGAMSESTFLATARPWPRYATDYRPMVQLARVRGWRVIAANIPRPLASAISRRGLRALDTLTVAERRDAANALSCPNDGYFDRFREAMGGHAPGAAAPATANVGAAPDMTQLFYEAQCAKDETMAESIWNAVAGQERPTVSDGVLVPMKRLVMHVNGAFHSDYRQGTVERVRRRSPEARMLVITAVPVANPGTAVVGTEAAKADYVIFTRAPGSGR
jgi:uncharacterized iron-regulated protein